MARLHEAPPMLRRLRIAGTAGTDAGRHTLTAVLRLRVGRRAHLLLSGGHGVSSETLLEAADTMRRSLAGLGIKSLSMEIIGEDSAGREA